MSSTHSAYWANKILNAMCRQVNITAPTAVYLALFSDAAGTTELSGSSYARKDVSAMFGDAASASSIANTVAFDMATASGAWLAVAHVKLMDASTSGNVITGKALAMGALISGESHHFAIGGVTFTS